MKRILTITLTLILTTMTIAQRYAGKTALAELNIPVSAKTVSLGNSNAANVDDISAIYTNPAGLANMNTIKNAAISYTHNKWILDTYQANVSFAKSINNMTLGISWTYFNYGTIEKTTRDHSNEGTKISSNSNKYSLIYSQCISNLNVGIKFSLINNNIAGYNSNYVLTTDAGLQYKLNNINLAVGYNNLGTKYQLLEKSSYSLPLKFYGSASMNITKNDVVSLNVNYNVYDNKIVTVQGGYEHNFNNMFFARAGFNTAKSGIINMFNAGFGISVSNFNVNYALDMYENIGLTHRVDVSTNF